MSRASGIISLLIELSIRLAIASATLIIAYNGLMEFYEVLRGNPRADLIQALVYTGFAFFCTIPPPERILKSLKFLIIWVLCIAVLGDFYILAIAVLSVSSSQLGIGSLLMFSNPSLPEALNRILNNFEAGGGGEYYLVCMIETAALIALLLRFWRK